MKRLTPNMAVKDVAQTVKYYVENFGFTLAMAVSEDKSSIGQVLDETKQYIWANVMHGEIGLMFQTQQSIQEDVGSFFSTIGSSQTLYIEVEDASALFETVKDSVEIYKPLSDTWYGAKEFYIRDLNGYILAFSSRI